MSNNHIVTRNIGNLRGFSTDSIFIRPANVADRAINIQKAPDGTIQLRRGYQCQIAEIGGAGLGTFDDPANDQVQTVTVGLDGFLYNKLEKQIYLYYDGGVQNRYLTITIFTDPRFINTNPGWSVGPWSFSPWGAPSGESITCNIWVNRAAQVNGNQTNTNTFVVQAGHELAAGDVIQFYSNVGVFNQRRVLSTTATSITFDGYPVSVSNGIYITQFIDIPFRKGFDVISPFLISEFIAIITDPTNGVAGLKVAINGDSNYPAAFLQIFEPTIIDSNQEFTIDYWYWQKINYTVNPPLPGSANINYQNSPDFENASMAVFDDVIYVANGWDYPQKYDGQTVYRAGMPQGIRPPTIADNTTYTSLPFLTDFTYQYAITYEQVDNRGHIVEGEISETTPLHTITAVMPSALDVTVNNLSSTFGNNWNTNCAIATGGTASSYGPDNNGYYYDLVGVDIDYTLKIGDSAYYKDAKAAVVDGNQTDVVLIDVKSGHSIVPGDVVYFFDIFNLEIHRVVSDVTATTISIEGQNPVSVNNLTDIWTYKTSTVFGNVAIIDGNQTNTNVITVKNNYPAPAGYTIQISDIVEFIDAENNLQRRTVTATPTTTTITIDGPPVNVTNLFLISSINQRSDAITLRRLNINGATLDANSPISNNLRINIYRTLQGEQFGVNGDLYLIASIPNDSFNDTQVYTDGLADDEANTVLTFADPDKAPNPPPISKYIKCFGNQMFYAGGERGVAENSDRVFFSEGNEPENVPLATNSFTVPNLDDDITGLGVAGTTLVTTKNNSLWAATGNFLTGDIDIIQIAQGSNIGCAAHATIASVGTLMYFLHTNGVYAITENQLFPTDSFGNPIPLSLAIDVIFRETPFLPQYRYVFKRAVAINYTKDNQYWLFLPCEDSQSSIRTANANSTVLTYDYQGKNWYQWYNINAAGGMCVIDDNIYFQERRFSGVDGNTANLYKQHRFYRLIDHADHAGPQRCEWRSSWEDLGQPEVRKKFCRCILLMDRISDLYQFNNPQMYFSSYLDRIPNLQSTIANITQVDNIRNSSWSNSGWGWNYWSGYQDSFITVNLKGGTVAKSIQVGFTIQGINMDIRLAGFQLEAIPENRKTVVR